MKRTNRLMLYGAVGTALILGAYYLMRGPQFKAIWDWNDLMHTSPGALFRVRMPRGPYTVASPDLKVHAQTSVGTETLVVMVAPTSELEEYSIKSVLINEDTGETYPIEVVVHPISAIGTEGQSSPAIGQEGVSQTVNPAHVDRVGSIQGGQT